MFLNLREGLGEAGEGDGDGPGGGCGDGLGGEEGDGAGGLSGGGLGLVWGVGWGGGEGEGDMRGGRGLGAHGLLQGLVEACTDLLGLKSGILDRSNSVPKLFSRHTDMCDHTDTLESCCLAYC